MAYLDSFNAIIWSFVIIPLLVGCALWFTISMRGVQFRLLGHMFKLMFESPSSGKKKDKTTGEDKKQISSFHAFVVSCASRIGTGNLAGVASAIAVGGPGAVFWMWVLAFLGSATAFAESSLAQLYKRKTFGAYIGGPAYYMKYGLHMHWFGVLFSLLIIFAFALSHTPMHSNQICESFADTFGFPKIAVGVAITLFSAAIIIGGIQRIARFSSIVVPFMAVSYLLLTLVVLCLNITEIPGMMKLIVSNAFGFDSALGGTIGTAISQGVRRGVLSNEAGEGTAPNAAATAETSHPVKQALIQALGVYTDTIFICSCTAFIILLSGVYNTADVTGIQLTTRALENFIGPFARYFVSILIFFFAYSSIVAFYYYGETSVRFITHRRNMIIYYRIATLFFVFVGCVMTFDEVLSVIDICIAVMVFFNIIALLLLSPKVVALYKDYMRQLKEGKDPHFSASSMPEIMDDVDAWK